MNAFVVEYRYRDLALRARYREEHIRRLRGLAERGTVLLAGPRMDAGGGVLVLRAASAAEADAVMADDPYVLHDVVEDVRIVGVEVVVGVPGLV